MRADSAEAARVLDDYWEESWEVKMEINIEPWTHCATCPNETHGARLCSDCLKRFTAELVKNPEGRPYRLTCEDCECEHEAGEQDFDGVSYVTEEYGQSMTGPDENGFVEFRSGYINWKCPVCGNSAQFDSDFFLNWMRNEEAGAQQ